MRQILSPTLVTDTDYSYGEDTEDAPSSLITLSQKNNLLEDFEDHVDDIKVQISDQYDTDKEEMEDWQEDYDNALKLAKMNPEVEQKDFPFEGASRVMASFLMEAAIEFNSRYQIDVLSQLEPAKFEVVGQEKTPLAGAIETDDIDSNPKAARAERMKTYFNVKLRKSNWCDESDQESMALPIVGTTYRKIMWNDRKKEVCSYFVTADKVIFCQQTPFEDAPQIVHELEFSRNELIGNLHAGVFEFDEDALPENKEAFEGYEAHFYYDFDEDGYAEPYIATCVDLGEDTIVRIRAGFIPEGVTLVDGKVTDIKRKEYFAQKRLLTDPEGGPMGIGFGILLKDSYETINSNLRQLLDAGTLANISGNSGLIANTTSPRMGMDNRMGEGEIEIEIGKLKKVNVSGSGTLAQNVVQLPFKGPHVVLFQLLQYLEESARRLTTVSYNVEANAQEASSLYLARLQQGMKVYNAMMYRVFRGLKKEFELMAECFYEYAEELQSDYVAVLDEDASMADDFNPDDCDIIPTANPAHGSDMERLAKAELEVQAAANPNAQGIINTRQAYLDLFEAAGIENLDQLMPEPDPGPTQQEKIMMAYQSADMEFRNRDMQLKERKMMMEEMELGLKAQRELEKMNQEAALNNSKVDVNIATAFEKMAGVAMDKAREIQVMLDRAEQNLQQPIGQTDGGTGSSQSMAGNARNEGVPRSS